MTALLLIPSVDHAETAVEQASEYWVHQRRYRGDPARNDALLGIWVRRELDADLPALCPGDHCGTDTVEGSSGGDPSMVPVGIRTSSAVSGLWSMCWLDGPALRDAHDPHQRRRRILDLLVQPAAAGCSTPGEFFPVFARSDSRESIDAHLTELGSRYPDLVASQWYVDDPERGISAR